jgi:hypothetical protein
LACGVEDRGHARNRQVVEGSQGGAQIRAGTRVYGVAEKIERGLDLNIVISEVCDSLRSTACCCRWLLPCPENEVEGLLPSCDEITYCAAEHLSQRKPDAILNRLPGVSCRKLLGILEGPRCGQPVRYLTCEVVEHELRFGCASRGSCDGTTTVGEGCPE